MQISLRHGLRGELARCDVSLSSRKPCPAPPGTASAPRAVRGRTVEDTVDPFAFGNMPPQAQLWLLRAAQAKSEIDGNLKAAKAIGVVLKDLLRAQPRQVQAIAKTTQSLLQERRMAKTAREVQLAAEIIEETAELSPEAMQALKASSEVATAEVETMVLRNGQWVRLAGRSAGTLLSCFTVLASASLIVDVLAATARPAGAAEWEATPELIRRAHQLQASTGPLSQADRDLVLQVAHYRLQFAMQTFVELMQQHIGDLQRQAQRDNPAWRPGARW
ncbi:hypothetical protein [Vineibacter terrae]|uniref:hypothetical protein n=1 Tax=Vineibacter terrae TaxID=2586908 RepID=UPI002E356220|nr:hypothetical protein [Vineibacter terrae]